MHLFTAPQVLMGGPSGPSELPTAIQFFIRKTHHRSSNSQPSIRQLELTIAHIPLSHIPFLVYTTIFRSRTKCVPLMLPSLHDFFLVDGALPAVKCLSSLYSFRARSLPRIARYHGVPCPKRQHDFNGSHSSINWTGRRLSIRPCHHTRGTCKSNLSHYQNLPPGLNRS